MLPAYNDCPRRAIARQFRINIENAGYKLNTILPSIGAAVGTATHKVIEHYFQCRIADADFVEFQALDMAMTNLQDEIKEGALWDDTTTSIDTARLQIQRMANVYIECIGRNITPIATEVSVKAEFEDWGLTGTIDLVAESSDGVGIVDFKTGAVVRSHHAQTGAYSLLYRSANPDVKVNSISIDFIKRIPKRNPQSVPVTTNYDVNLCEQVAWNTIQRIKREYEEFEKTLDPFCFPENTMSMLCSQKYCPCFNTDFCPITKSMNNTDLQINKNKE